MSFSLTVAFLMTSLLQGFRGRIILLFSFNEVLILNGSNIYHAVRFKLKSTENPFPGLVGFFWFCSTESIILSFSIGSILDNDKITQKYEGKEGYGWS